MKELQKFATACFLCLIIIYLSTKEAFKAGMNKGMKEVLKDWESTFKEPEKQDENKG